MEMDPQAGLPLTDPESGVLIRYDFNPALCGRGGILNALNRAEPGSSII